MSDEVWSLRDRARQCREMAQKAGDEPMRSMLERMAADMEKEADRIEGQRDPGSFSRSP
jgi:DNA-binding ferritin-like protein